MKWVFGVGLIVLGVLLFMFVGFASGMASRALTSSEKAAPFLLGGAPIVLGILILVLL